MEASWKSEAGWIRLVTSRTQRLCDPFVMQEQLVVKRPGRVGPRLSEAELKYDSGGTF